ncbi:MAG: PilC/PilY family type IV pilus protein, partial [Gammaproteobacteria bacterium]|nr:PilC/PilY family type IV pilus protein [Gammaproteobacteria bacterium]
ADKAAVSKSWNTILVGGLGGGGKGYYALNVTDPSDFGTETTAQNIVLWEFTDADDTYPEDSTGTPIGGSAGATTDLLGQPVKDLGYTYSQPQIAMTNVDDGATQKKWAAIFGNGYNSTAGIATLFIANVDGGLNGWSGGDVVKLTTDRGVKATPDPLAGLPNGLGTPAVVDKNFDGTADLVYAGDLFGNLYRFDISDPDPANWTTTRLFQATYDETLATRQPITVQPFVFRHPTETGVIIVFGTGSYITEGDATSTDIQSVYAIWDRFEINPATAASDAKSTRLVKQTVTNIVDETSGFPRQRIVSAQPVDYAPDTAGVDGVYGWYFDLDMTRADTTVQGNPNTDATGQAAPLPQFPGERAIRRIVPRGDSLLLTTVVPRAANTCLRSPPGAIMPVDMLTGGNPKRPIIDLNNDGVLDANDLHSIGGVMYAGGILFGAEDLDGTLVDPSILLGSGDDDFLFLSGGDDQLTMRIAGALTLKTGRLSWRQIDIF